MFFGPHWSSPLLLPATKGIMPAQHLPNSTLQDLIRRWRLSHKWLSLTYSNFKHPESVGIAETCLTIAIADARAYVKGLETLQTIVNDTKKSRKARK